MLTNLIETVYIVAIQALIGLNLSITEIKTILFLHPYAKFSTFVGKEKMTFEKQGCHVCIRQGMMSPIETSMTEPQILYHNDTSFIYINNLNKPI